MSGFDTLPGETSIDDLSGLIIQGVRTRNQLNEAEAENILDAFTKYLGERPSASLAPFNLDWCYALHGDMFGRVWVWAGRKRTHDLNLGLPHYQIDVTLHELMQDLRQWESTMPVAEQAVRLHHRAVSIHPFLNGNGRWSRLLANIWLAQHDAPVVLWPEITIGTVSTIRTDYLAAVRAADQGEYGCLTDLHREYSVDLPT